MNPTLWGPTSSCLPCAGVSRDILQSAVSEPLEANPLAFSPASPLAGLCRHSASSSCERDSPCSVFAATKCQHFAGLRRELVTLSATRKSLAPRAESSSLALPWSSCLVRPVRLAPQPDEDFVLAPALARPSAIHLTHGLRCSAACRCPVAAVSSAMACAG